MPNTIARTSAACCLYTCLYLLDQLHYLAPDPLFAPGRSLRSQDAASCLDAWAFLCQLLANPAVAERCPAAAASLEMLSVSWRKMHMNAMEQATLTAAAVVLQVGSTG